ncbi:MAG: hypothetical protein K2R98_23220 [Gemmataceae bacterium]|nr:hypothetical protein [Gemmataceae bacterium]
MIARHASCILFSFFLLAGTARADDVFLNVEAIADEDLCKSAGLGVDGPSLLDFFRKRTPSEADLKRVGVLIEQLDSVVFKVRQDASDKLVAIGPPALAQLKKAAVGNSLEMAQRAEKCIEIIERATAQGIPAAAARLLRFRKPDAACAVLLAYLPFAEDEDIEEAVLTALMVVGVHDGKVDAALTAALTDKAALPRAAAALVLGRSGSVEQRTEMRKRLADPEVRVRLRAAQGLTGGRDSGGVATLAALLTDAPLPLAVHAEDLLMRVAGEDAKLPPLGDSDESRKKCRAAWEDWWKEHEKKVDLAKADVHQPLTSAARRARVTSTRYVAALIKADVATAMKLSELPFCLAGILTLTKAEELENIYKSARQPEQLRTLLVERVVPLDEYARGCEEKMKEFLDTQKKNEVRAVYVSTKEGKEVDRCVLIVRIAGSQPKVIGIGEYPGKKK